MISEAHVKETLKNNAQLWEKNYPKEVIYKTAKIVNYVIRQIYEIISARQYSIPDQTSLEASQRQYTLGFMQSGLRDATLIENGLKKFRLSAENVYFPTVGQFINLCMKTDLPDLELAYKEACKNSHFASDKQWTHDVIRYAARETGSFILSNQPRNVSFKAFEYNYQIATRKFLNNELETDFKKAITESPACKGKSSCAQSALNEIKKSLGMK